MATTSTTEKAQGIVTRLGAIREGLLTISQLLEDTNNALAAAQAQLNNPSLYIKADKVGKGAEQTHLSKDDVERDYVLRSELETAKALLSECQGEIDRIDDATSGVEGVMTTLVAKSKTIKAPPTE